MNETDKDNSALLCATFREAIANALTGPLGKQHGSREAVVAALLAVTADFSRAIGVDFTHMSCAMIVACEPDSAKAIGALISSYSRSRPEVKP